VNGVNPLDGIVSSRKSNIKAHLTHLIGKCVSEASKILPGVYKSSSHCNKYNIYMYRYMCAKIVARAHIESITLMKLHEKHSRRLHRKSASDFILWVKTVYQWFCKLLHS